MDDKLTRDQVLRAKISVVMDQPFYATLMMRKMFEPDSSIETAVTNGKVVRYNPEWVESLSFEQLKGVICKMVMHTAMMHHTRRGDRDEDLWNQACDYAIGPILKDSGFHMPEGFRYDEQYRDQSAEEIYKLLGKKPGNKDPDGDGGPPPDKQPGQQPGDQPCGGVEDAPADVNIQEAEAEAKMELAQAMQMAKQAGKGVPGNMDRFFELLQPKVSWREVIARFLSEPARNDYTFSRPNKRYLQSGFVMPSLYSLEVGEIVLIGDTSISMDKDALNRVGTEMHDVASSFNAHMTALWVDEEFQGVQCFEPDEELKLEPKGGGGTDFRPGFEWLEKNNIIPKSVIYFTDGECHDFPKEPEYPVLWCITGGYKFVPPFGEVIRID